MFQCRTENGIGGRRQPPALVFKNSVGRRQSIHCEHSDGRHDPPPRARNTPAQPRPGSPALPLQSFLDDQPGRQLHQLRSPIRRGQTAFDQIGKRLADPRARSPMSASSSSWFRCRRAEAGQHRHWRKGQRRRAARHNLNAFSTKSTQIGHRQEAFSWHRLLVSRPEPGLPRPRRRAAAAHTAHKIPARSCRG